MDIRTRRRSVYFLVDLLNWSLIGLGRRFVYLVVLVRARERESWRWTDRSNLGDQLARHGGGDATLGCPHDDVEAPSQVPFPPVHLPYGISSSPWLDRDRPSLLHRFIWSTWFGGCMHCNIYNWSDRLQMLQKVEEMKKIAPTEDISQVLVGIEDKIKVFDIVWEANER